MANRTNLNNQVPLHPSQQLAEKLGMDQGQGEFQLHFQPAIKHH